MTEEINENDPQARAIREAADAYAERVANGERPWESDPDPGFDTPRSRRASYVESEDTAAPAANESKPTE